MTDTVFHVWKAPKEHWHTEDCEFGKRGVFPTGELMGVFEDRDEAWERRDALEEHSPSDRFDEQPYVFHVDEREVE